MEKLKGIRKEKEAKFHRLSTRASSLNGTKSPRSWSTCRPSPFVDTGPNWEIVQSPSQSCLLPSAQRHRNARQLGETSVFPCVMCDWWQLILAQSDWLVSPTYWRPNLLLVFRWTILEDIQEARNFTLKLLTAAYIYGTRAQLRTTFMYKLTTIVTHYYLQCYLMGLTAQDLINYQDWSKFLRLRINWLLQNYQNPDNRASADIRTCYRYSNRDHSTTVITLP